MAMKSIYLVDVSSLFFRAFYAIPPLNAPDGMPTNALVGVLNMTAKLLNDFKPDYVAYCLDPGGKTFRHEMFEDYKANRSEMPDDLRPQVPWVRELVELLGIKCVLKKGYEADDIIGSLSKQASTAGLKVTIVSGDKDFAQLIDDKVEMFDPMREVRYDIAGVEKKWGVKPSQMRDYLALVGDASDNIPGVKGIGQKSAQKLLTQFETIEGVYKNIDKVGGKSQKQKLIDGQDMAKMSQDLVQIELGLDFDFKPDDYLVQERDEPKIAEVFDKLGFKNLKKNFIKNSVKEAKKTSKPKKSAKVVSWSLEEFSAQTPPYCDLWVVEQNSKLTFTVGKQIVIFNGEDYLALGKILSDKLVIWNGFNLKPIWRKLSVKNPRAGVDLSLLSFIQQGKEVESLDDIVDDDLVKDESDQYNVLELSKYALERLGNLPETEERFFKEIDTPLNSVLHNMESNGIYLDKKILSEQSDRLDKELDAIEEKIYADAGEEFNILSPKQLANILFEKLKLPVVKKTKTGYSTNQEVLNKLAKDHPICAKVIEYRELAKLLNTYVNSLPELVNEKSHRIHTDFRQTSTATGRLSSVNPNLQNIPIRTQRGRDIRKAFVSEKDFQFISSDYSQIELRIMAHITEDPALIKAFNDDLDIHQATAAEIFKVSLANVDEDQRRAAKAVNFGIAYGQGAFGLAETLNISRKEAKEIIDNYFKRFPGVAQYMEDVVEQATENGYVENIFGRKRIIKELRSQNPMMKKFGERAAINSPMQSTASDLVKMAMIELYQKVSCRMLLQVHDEILFECHNDYIEEESKIIVEIMESIYPMRVPLKVNVNVGNSWAEAH